MCHIGHIRYAIHGFFPLFFRDLYVIQAYREMYGFVELVYFLEFIHLSINNKCDQDAKSYNFTVKMIFLYDRVIGQRIEYGVGQTAVVVRGAVLCEEDRGNAGRIFDGPLWLRAHDR